MPDRPSPDRHRPRAVGRGRLCVLLAALALLGPGATVGHAASVQPTALPVSTTQDDGTVDCATDAPPEGCGASVGDGGPGAPDPGSSDAGTSLTEAAEPVFEDAGGAAQAGAAGAGSGDSGAQDDVTVVAQTSEQQPALVEQVQVQEVTAAPTTLQLALQRETVHVAEDLVPTARLTSEGQPVVGAQVQFAVGDATSTGTTDDGGVATSPDRFVVGADVGSQVEVRALYGGQEGTYLGSEDVRAPTVVRGQCTLVNETSVGQLPTGQLALAARFTNLHGTTALAERRVVFTVQTDGGEPSELADLTDAEGVAVALAQVGDLPVTVTASFAGDGQFEPCRSEAVVVDVPQVEAVQLTPERSASVVGTTRSLTATVTDVTGLPVAGALVVLRSVAGPSAGAPDTGPLMTDVTGTAVFAVTGTALGTDVLAASVLPPPVLQGTLLEVAEAPSVLAVSEEVTLSWVYAPTGGGLAAQPAEAADLAQSLAGPGVTIGGVTASGHPSSFGTFTGGDGVVGFGGGIVMSSGQVQSVGPGTSLPSFELGGPGDPVLDGLVGGGTEDASVLAFDFVPTSKEVLFRYVFASSEYSAFVNSSFNDVFVFQVNGQNCATVPGSGALVRINDINAGEAGSGDPLVGPRAAPHLFLDNDGPEPLLGTGLGGLTTVLTCRADVLAGQVNQMRLAIADVSDSSLDSAVFLQAESLVAVGRAVEVTPETGSSAAGTTATVLAGVFDDGSPVAQGVPVTVVVTGVGETLTSTLVTGPAGTVPFSWTRSAAGTDTVVATTPALGAGGLLSSTPRTWTWTPAPVLPPVQPPPVQPPPVQPPPVQPPPVQPPPVDPLPVPGPVEPDPTGDQPPLIPALPLPTPSAGDSGPVVVPVDPVTGLGVVRRSPSLATTLLQPSAFVDPLTGDVEDDAAQDDATEPPDVLPFADPDPTDDPDTSGNDGDGGDVLDVALDRPSSLPGGVAQVTGQGCAAGERVVLSVGGDRVAATTADGDGRFEATLDLPLLDVGVHEVEARCGSLVQSVPLTLVVGSSVGGAAAAASTVGVVLAFFVLLATLFLLNGPGAPSAAALAAAQAAREEDAGDEDQ